MYPAGLKKTRHFFSAHAATAVTWLASSLHIKEGIMIITSRKRSKAAIALCALSPSLPPSDTSVNRTFEVAASTNRTTIGCCDSIGILHKNATDYYFHKVAGVWSV